MASDQPASAVGGAGEFEPGSQEAGRLGALAGSDEYEHLSHSLLWTGAAARGDRDEEPAGDLWVSHKSLGAGRSRIGQTPQDQRDAQGERGAHIGG